MRAYFAGSEASNRPAARAAFNRDGCRRDQVILDCDRNEEECFVMPKLKTHKGMKKRFKISATGKVSHKRCGSSHLMSHKSGKRVRRLRKSTTLKVAAEAHRIRNAMLEKQNVNPVHVATLKHEAMAENAEAAAATDKPASST